jgi:DNA-binding transcriptional ArsR family regulator
MTARDETRDTELLPEETARRLLARASELEVARGAAVSVGELREAARAAGIAPSAFEQALAELRDRDGMTVAPAGLVATRSRRLARFWPAALAAALTVALLLARLFP